MLSGTIGSTRFAPAGFHVPSGSPFQMAFQAGDIGFSGDLRQIKGGFPSRRIVRILRRIVHDDPVSAHDPLHAVAVLHLFTGNV